MRPLAWLLSRRARLAVPLALLALVGGVAAATAATSASAAVKPAKPTPFTWHALSLENGWKSTSTKSVATGTPGWAVRDGVVYLRGAVKETSSSGTDIIAQLPQSAWPTHALYLQVYTNGGTPGILFVSAFGTVEAYDGNARAFTSLAGVSYLSKTAGSTALGLENGWASSQSAYNTGNPAYSVRNGVVYLSGSMHTSGTSRLAFVLPKAARPASGLYISVYTLDGTTGWLHIQSNGEVHANGVDATGYTELASIAFPVAGTKWHAFALTSGWKSGAGQFSTAAPSYAVVNGVIYLTGSIRQPASGKSRWTVLPATVRTTTGDQLDLEVDTSGGTTGALNVTRTLGLAASSPGGNARTFTSLTGIAYPASS